MTRLTSERHVRRETAAAVRDTGKLRPVTVTLHPGFMMLRLKGRRRGYMLGYEAAYRAAVESEQQRQRDGRRSKRASELAPKAVAAGA
jgi:hypothetical protein